MVLQAPAQPTTVEAPPAHPDAPSPGQRPEPSTERRSLRRRLRAPAIATVVVQAVLAMGDRMPSVDATAYFATGRNVLEGAGYTRHGAPEMHFPPVAPIGYALGERLLGSEMAALRVLHLTAGLACVVLLVALAKLLSEDDDVVVATAWLATTVGGLVCLAIRGGSGSELLTVDLLLGAALVALGGPARASMSGGRLAGRAAAVGALVGIAYLTRPEALVPGLLLGLPATHVRHQPRRTLVGLAAFAVVLGALVAPYVAFQHAHTGSWALTSKSQDASIEAWRSVAEGDRRARDEVLYAIDDTGTGLGSETRSLTTLAREDPAGWLGIVATNAATIGRWYLLAQLLPLFL
ncbi:MAG: hypothetical protein KDA97_15245, partial [Acidimicrobiales bacterium]|nr:hypothetical protein [Acidimicrobiales bacterium]